MTEYFTDKGDCFMGKGDNQIHRHSRRVEELIHIIPEEKEAYLETHLNPSAELVQLMWMHGMRKQFYFDLGDQILMSFEYVGKDFHKDMTLMSCHPLMKEFLIPARRRDIPVDKLETTNWWAPLKRYGGLLLESPIPDDEDVEQEQYLHSLLSGCTVPEEDEMDFAYDEDDWSESVHI